MELLELDLSEEVESNPKLVSEPLSTGFFRHPLIWLRTPDPAFL